MAALVNLAGAGYRSGTGRYYVALMGGELGMCCDGNAMAWRGRGGDGDGDGGEEMQ